MVEAFVSAIFAFVSESERYIFSHVHHCSLPHRCFQSSEQMPSRRAESTVRQEIIIFLYVRVSLSHIQMQTFVCGHVNLL